MRGVSKSPGFSLYASNDPPERWKAAVILSEAKDHLATLDPLKMILRFAQDESQRSSLCTMTVTVLPTLGITRRRRFLVITPSPRCCTLFFGNSHPVSELLGWVDDHALAITKALHDLGLR